MRAMVNYVYNIFVALDQLVNVVLLFGDPDETISSRVGKSYVKGGWAAKVPWPPWAKRHFTRSIEGDRGQNSTKKRTEII